MNDKEAEKDLKRLLKQSDQLLDELDEIDSELKPKENDDQYKRKAKKLTNQVNTSPSSDSPQTSLLLTLLAVAALAVAFLIYASSYVFLSQKGGEKPNPSQSKKQSSISSITTEDNPPPSRPDFKPKPTREIDPSQKVYFTGIDLPITNHLCNKKQTFCIYGMASLVDNEKGRASYFYKDTTAEGKRVNIQGDIRISELERSADGSRSFTFSFEDNKAATTPGWAAAGYFKLDQDTNKPGILTRFKTTQSFGPKTPVGLENTSYLFPQ